MSKSDVARLREQIEAECEALHMLNAPSIVATHAMIAHRYKLLEQNQEKLATILGEDEAKHEAYVRIVS